MREADSSSPYKPGGYREILAISIPLILSTSSFSLMHVVDRVFLSWYSEEALAASVPAGAAAWAFLALFVGTVGYVTTFVSQYDGAGRPERIGPAVWHGVYLAFFASVAIAAVSLIATPLFEMAGHDPAVRELEVDYFRILTLGAGGHFFAAALSGFYSGRGRTWVVMWVNLGGAILNGVLDYAFVFGAFGFPEWGIFGAGVATVITPCAMVAFYLPLMLLPENRRRYGTANFFCFDRDLFSRLLRFGLPSGLQFTADIMAFTLFVLLVGRIGPTELAASNIAFAINHLVFMPMVGLSMGLSVLVGRYLGKNEPDTAAATTMRSLALTLGYMAICAVFLVAIPETLMAIFNPDDSGRDFENIVRLGKPLLYFVAVYSIVDAANIVFSSALKGAGDTRFVLAIAVGVGIVTLVAPVYVACVVFGGGIYTAWCFLALWVFGLALAFWLRFRAGQWRTMRVIEHTPSPAAAVTEGPIVEG